GHPQPVADESIPQAGARAEEVHERDRCQERRRQVRDDRGQVDEALRGHVRPAHRPCERQADGDAQRGGRRAEDQRIPQRLHVEAARHRVAEGREGEPLVPGPAAAGQQGPAQRGRAPRGPARRPPSRRAPPSRASTGRGTPAAASTWAPILSHSIRIFGRSRYPRSGTGMTSTDAALREASSRNDALIDADLIRKSLACGLGWLLLFPTIGAFVSTKFNYPTLLGDLPWFTFGRLRPMHVNGVIWGAFSTLFIGLCYYIVPRLSGVRVWGSAGVGAYSGSGISI